MLQYFEGEENMLAGAETFAAMNPSETPGTRVSVECAVPDGRGVELSWGSAELAPGESLEDTLAAADVALLEQKTDKRR